MKHGMHYGKSGGMSYGSKGSKSGPPMRGITVPAAGNVAQGATMRIAKGSAGEKGRATDPNCDKTRQRKSNP